MSRQAKNYPLTRGKKNKVSGCDSERFIWLTVNTWKGSGAKSVVNSQFLANYTANALLTFWAKQHDVKEITEIILIKLYWRQAGLQKEV